MSEFVSLITSFPVVVFTALLIFSSVWWFASMLVGIGDDFDLDLNGDGMTDDFGFGTIPLALAVTVISGVGWIAAVLLSTAANLLDLSIVSIVMSGVIVLAASLAAGVWAARRVGKLLAPLYETELLPSVTTAQGSLARVRSPKVNADTGEIIVVNGPVRSTILAARTTDGEEFAKDATVLVVGPGENNTWLVTDTDDLP